MGTVLRLPEPEIRHTTSAQPTRIIRFHVRTRKRPTDGPTVSRHSSPECLVLGVLIESLEWIFARRRRPFRAKINSDHNDFVARVALEVVDS